MKDKKEKDIFWLKVIVALLVLSHLAIWFKIGMLDRIDDDYLYLMKGMNNNTNGLIKIAGLHNEMFADIYGKITSASPTSKEGMELSHKVPSPSAQTES
jgi:hypothetical protein